MATFLRAQLSSGWLQSHNASQYSRTDALLLQFDNPRLMYTLDNNFI